MLIRCSGLYLAFFSLGGGGRRQSPKEAEGMLAALFSREVWVHAPPENLGDLRCSQVHSGAS